MLQRGIEAYRNDAFAGLHHEGGHSQHNTRNNHLPAQADGGFLQLQKGGLSPEEAQNPQAGNGLGQNGGKGCTLDAHGQSVDENWVQDNVAHRTHQHRKHSRFGKALGGNKGVHTQSQLDENGADGVDIHVIHGIANGIVAGTEGVKKRPVPKEQRRCQHHGNENLQQEAVAQNLLCVVMLLPAHSDGSHRGTAVADEGGKSRHNHDNGHTHAHAG